MQARINKIPPQPGVYKFLNKKQELIYVGKAKDLRKRVRSYFTKSSNHNRKTQRLVSEIVTINFVVTSSEFDALLLENNLIKANQPKYNILLKDDKSFPFICVTNERFPRVYATRRLIKSKGKYFGPFTSVVSMNNVIELLQKLYTLRTCNYNLSEKNVVNKKYKVCLEFHIGNCLGPCEGLQDEADYLSDIQQVESILKGKLSIVKTYFKDQMQKQSEDLAFEKANSFKQKLVLLDKFQTKSMVVNPAINDVHIISIVTDDKHHYVNYMRVKSGAIVYSQTKALISRLDEPPGKVLALMFVHMLQLDEKQHGIIGVLSNKSIEELPDEFQVTIPKIGDKKKLVDLSLKNAFALKREGLLTVVKEDRGTKVLKILQKDLSLTALPEHIECFDNSNLQGSNPVASMVSFKHGRPSKKDYRKYTIKTVVGPDDFASMTEIVSRRYGRLINEKKQLPDLILIDGGKGQLNAATKALKELGIYGKMAVAGIAKRLEEIYLPADPLPVHISKKSPSLKLLQQIRDEAHRFAISFHRQKRMKSINTNLISIPGIGGKTANKLLINFKSLKKIKSASVQELTDLIGQSKGLNLYNHLQKKICYPD